MNKFPVKSSCFRFFLLQLTRYLDEKVDSANIFIENERNEGEEERGKKEQETCSYKAFALPRDVECVSSDEVNLHSLFHEEEKSNLFKLRLVAFDLFP